jgi:hypothetical protein
MFYARDIRSRWIPILRKDCRPPYLVVVVVVVVVVVDAGANWELPLWSPQPTITRTIAATQPTDTEVCPRNAARVIR